MIEPNKPITVEQIVSDLSCKLCKKYCDQKLCEQYAWWVLESITQKNKSDLIVNKTISLSTEQHQRLNQWIDDQVYKNIPLQYLIGSVPFIDCTIMVEPPVLIPRSETEWWCAEVIEQLSKINQPLNILDLCTGSGCIAIALAKAFPTSQITATDISTKALNLAKRNAHHNSATNINFISSDLFAQLENQTFDIIIANPPYISAQEFKQLDTSVKNWEDTHALMASENGLCIIKKIIEQSKQFLKPNNHNQPQLFIEIGHAQGDAVAHLLEQAQFKTSVWKDLYKKDRVAVGTQS